MRAPPRGLRRFRDARGGASMVEFGLLLPVMLLMLFGGFEYSRMIEVYRKMNITTRALCDLTTQFTTVKASDVATIMGASSQVFAPFDTSTMQITVSELKVDGSGNVTVVWSQATNTQPLAANSAITLPSGVAQNGTYLIWSQISYPYKPVFAFIPGTSRTFTDSLLMSPRLSASVDLSGS